MNNQIDERTHSAFRNSTTFSYFQGKSIRINKPIFCLSTAILLVVDTSYQLSTQISEATFMQHGAGQILLIHKHITHFHWFITHYSLHNNPEWNMSRCWREEKWYCHAVTGMGRAAFMSSRVSNKDYPKFSQSRRRPLLEPSPGWKRLLALSHLRHY